MASNTPNNPNLTNPGLPPGITPPPSPVKCPDGTHWEGIARGCVANSAQAPINQQCGGGKLWNQYTNSCICPGDTHEENGICKPGPVETQQPQGDCPPGQHHGGGHPGNPCLPNKPGAAPSAPGPSAPIEHSEGELQDLLYTMFLDRLGGFQTTPGLGADLPGYNDRFGDVVNLPGGGIASGYLPSSLTSSPFAAYESAPGSTFDLVNQLSKKKLGAGGVPGGAGTVKGGPAGVGGQVLYPPTVAIDPSKKKPGPYVKPPPYGSSSYSAGSYF